MSAEELQRDVARIIAEHVDEKRARLEMRVVWDGYEVRELAPWEPER